MKLNYSNQWKFSYSGILDKDIYYRAIRDITYFPTIFDPNLSTLQICKNRCSFMVSYLT